MRQFCIENSCLQPIHAAVDPFHDMLALTAMPGEGRHPVGELIVSTDKAASVPIGAQVFARIKGKGRCIAKGTHKLSLIPGEMCLGAIFYYPEIVLFRNRYDRGHVRRLSIEMNWNDSDGGRGNLCFNINRINRESLLIGVAEYDSPTSLRDCLRC